MDLWFAERLILTTKCWGGLTYTHWDCEDFCVGFDSCLRDNIDIGLISFYNVKKYMEEKQCNFYIANCYLLKDELIGYLKRGKLKKILMNKFIKQFHKTISKKDQNLVYSPWSIIVAMSMFYQGTSGKVKEQLRDYFDGIPQLMIHIKGSMEALTTANAIYVNSKKSDDTVVLAEGYEQLIKNFYEGTIERIPFDDEAVKKMNDFVELKTKGCIKDFIQSLDPATTLFILNAVHFKEKWEDPFDEKGTKKIVMFDEKNEVEMMRKWRSIELYGEHDWDGLKFKSCTLPYKAKGFEMTFFKTEELEKLESVIFEDNFISKVFREQSKKKLQILGIPKFKLRTKSDITACFQKMGITAPFSTSNNYEKMFSDKAPIPHLLVSSILHEAFIEVDEEGTEAAAATAIALSKSYIRDSFYLDKPFIAVLCFNNLPIFILKFVKPDTLKRKRVIENEKSKKVKYDFKSDLSDQFI